MSFQEFQEFKKERCGYVRTLSPEQQEKARRRALSYHSEHKDDPEYLEKRKAYSRAHYQANLEKQRARSRARYKQERETNPERIIERQKRWQLANIETERVKRRKRKLKVKYKLTQDEFEALLLAQGGVCAVCGTSEPGGPYNRWKVDHCHDTDTVRGLLCNFCNVGAGFFKHSSELLRKMATYLEERKNGCR
jgi:hypothetical protein